MHIGFEVLGWIGAILFCLCGIPQAVKAYRTRRTTDLSWLFLWMWFGGEIATIVYIIYTNIKMHEMQWSLITNYVFNIGIVIYLLRMKMRFG